MRRAWALVLGALLAAGCGSSTLGPAGGDGGKDAGGGDSARDTPLETATEVGGGGSDAVDAAAGEGGSDAVDGSDAVEASSDAAQAADGAADKGDGAGADGGDVADAGSDVGSTEAGGDGGQHLVGHWTFVTGTNNTTCSDASSSTRNLVADYIDVTRRDATTLVGSYFCDWQLDASPTGDTTTVRPNQSCMSTSSGRTYLWKATAFTISSTDGHAGTVSASIGVTSSALGQGIVTCTVVISGTLQK